MKKRIVLILAFICQVSLQSLYAQQICGGIDEDSNQPKTVDCSKSSDAYINKYSQQSYYIPNQGDALKTVYISFHIWDDPNDGLSTWENTAAHKARLQQVVDWMNGWHANSSNPSDPFPGVTHVQDTKLRFVLPDDFIYFYDQEAPSTSSSGGCENFMETNYPDRTHAIMIHVTPGYTGGGGGNSDGTSMNDNNLCNILTGSTANPVGDYALAQHLYHELGHNFKLLHLYDGSGCCPDYCSTSNQDFLFDCFDVNAPNTCGTSCDICYNPAPCHGATWDDPADFCTNNIMGGNTSFDYWVSQLQAGRMHRCSHLYSVRQYIWGYDPIPHEITQNETWDFSFKSYKDIIVKPGAKLTITCEVQMVPRSKIIVEPGGQLIIDGGTITKAKNAEKYYSDPLWSGIQVWGNENQSQIGGGIQGEVILKNDAVVEHAHVGIAVWNPGDWSTTGGIVKSYSSTFRNNKKDVEFLKYSNDYNGSHYANLSVFHNTTFTWNDDFLVDQPLTHFTMYKVDGVNFVKCNFRDERTNPNYLGINNTGIRAIDAEFSVTGECTYPSTCPQGQNDANWTGSEFTNLHHGIDVTNSGIEGSIKVDGSIFLNNQFGIEITDCNTPEIIRNKFYYSGTDNFYIDDNMYGVFSDYSNDLTIEENDFISSGLGDVNYSIGVLVAETEGTAEEIYKNSFTNLNVGNYSAGLNRIIDFPVEFSGHTGLEFLCNTNHNNSQDHLILGEDLDGYTNTLYGVKNENGSLYLASGNDLSQPLQSLQYSNLTDNDIYYYYIEDNPDFFQVPNNYVGPFAPIISEEENPCRSRLDPISGGKVTKERSQEHSTNDQANSITIEKSILADKYLMKYMRLADLHLENGEYEKVQNDLILLAEMNKDLPDFLDDRIDDFIAFKNAYINLLKSEGEVMNRENPNYSIIKDIADNGFGLAKEQADGLLCFFFDECREKSVPRIVGQRELLTTNKLIEEKTITVYPNPAYTEVNLDLPKTDESWTIVITDVAGKIISSRESSSLRVVIETAHLSGIYFIEVYNSKERLPIEKVIINN